MNVIYAQADVNSYQEVLNNATRNGVPAIVALIQTKEGKEWKGKSGVSSIEQATPLKIDESFRLASISKIFTTITIL